MSEPGVNINPYGRIIMTTLAELIEIGRQLDELDDGQPATVEVFELGVRHLGIGIERVALEHRRIARQNAGCL